MDCRAGGNTDQNTGFSCQSLAHCESVFVLNRNDLVIDLRVQGFRYKACADALDLVRACHAFGQYRRACRFYCDNFDVRVLALQIFADAGKRAAGADSRNENIHFAFCIVPDLRSGGRNMCLRVGRVGELARNEAARRLRRQFFRLRDRALHAFGTVCQYQFGAVRLEQVAAFYTHCFWHGQDDLISSGRRDGSQSDTGIAAGRFNDDRARFQHAGCFRVVDHPLGDPVLDAACRIEIFQLAEYRCFRCLIINVRV